MKRFLLIAILVAPTARAAEWNWSPPSTLETALFTVSSLAIAADCWTTIDARQRLGLRESNPLLGASPSRGRVLGFCGASLALNSAAWYLLPSPYRNIWAGMVTFYEAEATAENMVVGARFRF